MEKKKIISSELKCFEIFPSQGVKGDCYDY